MSESNSIFIKGARVNNLKNIDVEIPRNKLTVITGMSGSGKSSLAFDTIFAEGQAGGDNRAVGEWKIIVGVRYPLCGGTAPVCREFIRLRPPVLGKDE